jgi:hypothetical protein
MQRSEVVSGRHYDVTRLCGFIQNRLALLSARHQFISSIRIKNLTIVRWCERGSHSVRKYMLSKYCGRVGGSYH